MKHLILFVLWGLVNVLSSCGRKQHVVENEQQKSKEQEDIATKHSDTITKHHTIKKLKIKKSSIITLQSANQILKKAPANDEFIPKCKEWNLSSSSIVTIFKNGQAINMHDFSYLYYVLPCEIKGKVEIDSCLYTYKINAGSFFTLSNADTTYYFGCNNEKCRKFFLIPGGNPKRDLEQ